MLDRRNLVISLIALAFFADCDDEDDDHDRKRDSDVGDDDGVDRTETGYPYRTDDRRKKRRTQ